MTDTEEYQRLENIISSFSEESNSDPKVQKLIRKWSSSVLIWPEDIGKGFLLTVEAGRIISLERTEDKNTGKVKVVGSGAILSNMFQGKESISHLYMDGVVQTYGSEKDQIVLDAIARILWN